MKACVRLLTLTMFGLFALICAGATSAREILDRVGFDQHLGATLPLNLRFRDEAGRDVRLGEYFNITPVVLVFTYYGCSSLCPTVIGNLVDTLERSGLAPGEGYQVIVASIDPNDTPALASLKKAIYLGDTSRSPTAQAWHLLSGSETSITALTRAGGFRSAYDADTDQYAHPAGIVLLTPQGTIARYFFGFDMTPGQLRSALDAAAAQRIASPVERLLLLCYHFAPSGKYSALVLQALRWAALAMLLGLAAMFAAARWRSRNAGASLRGE